MRVAIVNGERHLPEKGIQGAICPVCEKPVIARCGEIRAHHWAHAKGTECSDSWSSGKETDWHLAWKNEFPDEWQERVLTDSETGEKHIADVLTDKNLVLEFQHSPIDPDERRAREAFYSKDGRSMVWIVDMRKIPNFLEKIQYLCHHKLFDLWYPIPSHPDRIFPKKWLMSSTIVLFDCNIIINNKQSQIIISLIYDIKLHIFCFMCNSKESIIYHAKQGTLIKHLISSPKMKVKVVKNYR